jgi:hypothetical protein
VTLALGTALGVIYVNLCPKPPIPAHLCDIMVVKQRLTRAHGVIAEVIAAVQQPLQLRQPPILAGRRQTALRLPAALCGAGCRCIQRGRRLSCRLQLPQVEVHLLERPAFVRKVRTPDSCGQ